MFSGGACSGGHSGGAKLAGTSRDGGDSGDSGELDGTSGDEGDEGDEGEHPGASSGAGADMEESSGEHPGL